jgi:hypothetical protein
VVVVVVKVCLVQQVRPIPEVVVVVVHNNAAIYPRMVLLVDQG